MDREYFTKDKGGKREVKKMNVSYLAHEKDRLKNDLSDLTKELKDERDLEIDVNPQKVEDLEAIISDLSALRCLSCSPSFLDAVEEWNGRDDKCGVYEKYSSSLESIIIDNFQLGGGKMIKESVNIEVEVSGIDEATKKAERYVELLKEAKTLADELASMEFEIGTNLS